MVLLLKRLFVLLFVLLTFSGSAQDSSAFKPIEWNFRIGPFFWLVNIKGTLEKPPTPTNYPIPNPRKEIDLNFADVSALLKFAFLLNAEYQHNRFVGALNNTSFILGGEAITPHELVANGIEYQFTTVMSEFILGYKIINRPHFDWEGYAGLKLVYFDIKASGNLFNTVLEGERNYTWLDPIIATKLRYRPWRKFEFVFYGDYGPIRERDELTSQFYVNLNYEITHWLYVAPGYRYWWFRVSRDEAIFNGSFNGAYVRLGFEF